MNPQQNARRLAVVWMLAPLLTSLTPGCRLAGHSETGVVVESREAGGAAARAGLEPGDLIVEWRQGRASGDVESPFHVAIVEQELAPHGPVELVVRREGDRRRVVVRTGRWRLQVRPRMHEAELATHLQARRLADDGALDEAIRLWQGLATEAAAASRSLEAAWLHIQAAVAMARAGRADACRAALEDGADAIDDRRIRAAYRERTGDVLREAGQMELAAESFQQALDLLQEEAPSSPAVAYALVQLSGTDPRVHDADARRALAIYRRIGSGSMELAWALSMVGTGAFYRSDLDAAERSYGEALELVREAAPGSPSELDLLGNLGLVAKRRGDFATAREYYQREQQAAERLGAVTVQYAFSSNYLGVLAKDMGRFERARRHYEQALAAFRDLRPGGVEVAGVLNNLGNLARYQDDLAAARRYHEEALSLRRQLDPGGTDVASSLHNVGIVARTQGDLASARRHLERALELKRQSHPGTLWMATTLYELGEVARQEGDLEAAAEQQRRALEIRRAVAPEHPDVADSLNQLGLVELERGQLGAAEQHWREAVALLEAQRRRLDVAGEQRASFTARFRSSHLNLARLLVHDGRATEAWDLLEQARAGALRALVARREAAPEGVPRELWFARARAENAVERLESRLVAVDPVHDAEALARFRERLAAAEAELAEINVQIRRAAPQLTTLEAPPALTLAELRRRLDAGTVVVSYALGDEGGVAMMTGSTADGGPEVRAFELSIEEAELAGRVDRFRSLIARGRTVTEVEPPLLGQGRHLFELLLEPAWDAIAEAERLLLVPDGPLVELPFAALVVSGDDARFLGQEVAIFVNPSASLAVELGAGTDARGAERRTVVAFGDPRYPPESPVVREHDLSDLPATRSEVEAIRALLGGRARVFLGAEASEPSFRSHAPAADVLHCAVHSRIDQSSPMDSALFFSLAEDQGDPLEDGVVSAWDIVDGLRTEAGLVVLSACSTGHGRVIPDEGVIGLARAFQVAGARTLLVSHWEVSDQATSALMTAFYRHLESGSSTVEALRRARRQLGRQGSGLAHPYSWASFQVRGDWR